MKDDHRQVATRFIDLKTLAHAHDPAEWLLHEVSIVRGEHALFNGTPGVVLKVQVLDEAMWTGTKEDSMKRETCPTCQGRGHTVLTSEEYGNHVERTYTCFDCNGRGHVDSSRLETVLVPERQFKR